MREITHPKTGDAIQVVESLDDPDLDLSRPFWLPGPPPNPDGEVRDVSDWSEIGMTSDIPAAFRREP